MELLGKYRITRDENNAILNVKKETVYKKHGMSEIKVSWKPQYYPSIKLAMMKIVDLESNGCASCDQILAKWDRLENLIKEKF